MTATPITCCDPIPLISEMFFFQNAWVMVDFFFVLSGYVISLAYWDRLATGRALLSFQINRFWRLYPLHLVMLLVFLGIEGATYLLQNSPTVTGAVPAFVENNFWSFAMNLLLLQNFTVHTLNWNYPSWSISAEFYTYLIFGVLMVLCGVNSWARRAVMLMVMGFALFVILQVGLGPTTIGPLRCLLAFFLGSLLFEVERKSTACESKTYNLFSGLWAILLVIYISQIHKMPFALQAVFPFLCAILILSVNRSEPTSILRRVLAKSWLIYLGAISYGLYMIHAAIWWILTLAMSAGFNVPLSLDENGEVVVHMDDPAIATVLFVGGVALIIALAAASYRYLEQPMIQKFSRKDV